jgi:hypothetical protein
LSIGFVDREITKSGNYRMEKGLPWPLPELKDQSLWPGNEMVTIEGQYTYNNGFGDTFTHKFCLLWLPHWSLQMPSPNGGGWSGGGWTNGSNETCPLREKENEFSGIKKFVKEATPK